MPGGIALQPHPQSVKASDQVEVVGIMTPIDQRGERDLIQLDDPSNLQNHVYFDVETPDVDMHYWNQSPDHELNDLMLEAREHEQALQEESRTGPRRSSSLLEKFTAAATHTYTAPEGGLEGCQKALAQYASKVKWHVPVQQRLHMFEEESQKLDDSLERLSKSTKKKYVSWDIQDLLDFEDPDISLDEKMEI